MRIDSPDFAAANTAAAKRPRLVVRHIFDVGSIYVTSSKDMVNVPGTALLGHLRGLSGVSQEIFPDKARSTIGDLSYSIVDIDEEFSAALRNQLQVELQDLHERDVELRFGYTDDYNDTTVLFTQQARRASFDDGVYSIGCEDIQRATRKEIFDPIVTTLRLSVSATADTIPVQDTTGFQTVFHGPSYGDAPNLTVGYLRLDDEIIRYTGTTPDSFTGCTRGVFNTIPAAHVVEAGAEDDRQPEVKEFIYLQLPGPKLDYAILTGVLSGDAATLPPHWHLGVPTSKVALSQFQGIGPDLWNISDDSATVPLRFAGLEQTDGKQFLEEQVRQPIGVYAPVLSDGSLGLRRMNHILDDAPYVETLDANSFIQIGALEHDYRSLINVFEIDWNWDPIAERFTRKRVIVDQASIDVHGQAETKSLAWEGLHGSRHTDAELRKRADSIRDRYASPPLRMPGQLLHAYNALEVGDVVRVNLEHVRDYTGPAGALDRSFEIQRVGVDQFQGRVSVNLFGSTSRASVLPPDTGVALPDAFYSSEGTELSTVVNIVGGVVQPGTYNLTGNTDLNNAGAIYYYLGDLELADGATITPNDNVQLRIRGFLTGNGDIDGVGRGNSGAVDDGILANQNPGTPGFIGTTLGWGGLEWAGIEEIFSPRIAPIAVGQHFGFPFLDLSVEGNSLIGLPTDLRGTSGGIGGRITNAVGGGTLLARGGSGGASGAGLAIICRGAAFGLSASIDLSGGDSQLGEQTTIDGQEYRAGSGAPGGPGSLLFVIDGSAASLPNALERLNGSHGSMPNAGTEPVRVAGASSAVGWPAGAAIRSGFNDALVLNMTASILRIQRLAGQQTPTEDVVVPAPTALSVTANSSQTGHVLSSPQPPTGVITEYLASITDNRADAVVIGASTAGQYEHSPVADTETFYWSRNRSLTTGQVSEFFPATQTTTAIGAALGPPQTVLQVSIYRRADTIPATPTPNTGSYDFDTKTLTPPAGWSATPLAPDGTPQYISTGTFAVTGSSGVSTTVTWSTPTLSSIDPPTSSGVIINGGFENGVLAPWNSIPQLATANPRSGIYHGLMAPGAGGPNAISNRFAVSPGQIVQATAWVARDEGDLPDAPIALQMRYYDAAGVQSPGVVIQTSQVSVPGYQQLTGQLTVPVDTVEAAVDVGESAAVVGNWHFDDVSASIVGADAVSSQLTNDVFVVQANPDGSGYSLTGGTGTHQVFDGGQNVTGQATHSIVGAATVDGLTCSVDANGAYSLTGASWTGTAAQFTLRAAYQGVNYDKVFSVTKVLGEPALAPNLFPVIGIELFDLDGTTAEVAILWSSDGNLYTREGFGSSYGAGTPWRGTGTSDQFQLLLETSDTALLEAGSANANQWLPMNFDQEFIVRRETADGNGNDTLAGFWSIRRNTDNVIFETKRTELQAVRGIA